MMRRSLGRRQDARAVTIGAPVGGWDAKNPIADMPAENAIVLDNWFPDRDKLVLRNGSSAHATIPTEFTSEFSAEFTVASAPTVETLMEYIPPSGNAKMFAAAGPSLYDVTTAGIGSEVATGFTSAEFVHTQIGNNAGHFLFAANGEDTLQRYDGSTWADSAITGTVTLADVAWVSTHQNRLWLGEKNSLGGYYLATQAVAGAATSFSLESVAKLGGYIVGMGTWTRDGGDGTDDVAVFVTSEGEAILYTGTDPSSASTWSLIGVFRIGRPLNRRSMLKAGSDLIIATESGVVPLSRVLSTDRSQTAMVALSDQINQAFTDAVVDAAGATSTWQVFLYPRGNMLIVNVPRASEDPVQFVFNTLTGAPCRFTGMAAQCWCLLNDVPYYGGAAGVVRFDNGDNDLDEPIVGNGVPAFNYFRTPANEKRFSRIELVLEGSAEPLPTVDVMTDFEITAGSPLRGPAPSEGGQWDVGTWDVGTWGAEDRTPRRAWEGITGHGRAATVRVQVNSLYARPAWIATNWIFTPGGVL